MERENGEVVEVVMEDSVMKKLAMFWEKGDDKRVRCTLCPHYCELKDGAVGICRMRKNEGGQLFSIGYGQTTSLAMDPIEKKPLFHYKPGTYVLSVAPNGCNLRCNWCQNWQISQAEVATRYLSPESLVSVALRERLSGISFTYTEPMIWYEYIIDVARLARAEGIGITLVTNGYINQEPLEQLLPNIDAMNVDLKAMNDDIYVRCIGGHLEPVLNTIRVASGKCLLEVTNLVIPTLNSSEEDMRAVVDFIAEVNPKIPLHFSRYYPCYNLDISATPPDVLLKAYEIGKEKLPYVYIGNIPIEGAEDTCCPNCGNLLVQRKNFSAQVKGIANGRCSNCAVEVDFVI